MPPVNRQLSKEHPENFAEKVAETLEPQKSPTPTPNCDAQTFRFEIKDSKEKEGLSTFWLALSGAVVAGGNKREQIIQCLNDPKLMSCLSSTYSLRVGENVSKTRPRSMPHCPPPPRPPLNEMLTIWTGNTR